MFSDGSANYLTHWCLAFQSIGNGKKTLRTFGQKKNYTSSEEKCDNNEVERKSSLFHPFLRNKYHLKMSSKPK